MATQIKLPKDAEGREVPLDTEVMYDANGKKSAHHQLYVQMRYSRSLGAVESVQPGYYGRERRNAPGRQPLPNSA